MPRFKPALIVLSFLVITLTVSSCKELRDDSMFKVSVNNLARVSTPSVEVAQGDYVVTAEVTSRGSNSILRYGFLVSASRTSFRLDEEGRSFFESSNVAAVPFPFSTAIGASDISSGDKYIVSYVVNESGIVYSDPLEIQPLPSLSRIVVTSDNNNNGRIEAGETVTLRFEVTNLSPIQSTGSRVTSINEFSNFISNVTPNSAIPVSPSTISLGSVSSFSSTFEITSSANSSIPINIIISNDEGYTVDLKTLEGDEIRIQLE